VDDDTAEPTVAAAWDRGLRWFDTAPHYGLGLSERRLGRALHGRPREAFVVSTKVGRLLDPVEKPDGDDRDTGFAVPAAHVRRWDFSFDGVRRSLQESLVRLGSTGWTSPSCTTLTTTWSGRYARPFPPSPL
jgi:D-threo-aldose 1-dehydrogenase